MQEEARYLWQFETLQEKDGLTNQREGCWGGCEFPVWLKAQIVVKGGRLGRGSSVGEARDIG